MPLIDRYIDAVRTNLPRAQRDDIASELREILQTQIEEQEVLNRRPLTDKEVLDILKTYGHPHVVAGRYGAHQYLIGPGVFPSYVSSVKIVLWLFVPLAAFMALITVLTAKEPVWDLLGTLWTMLGIGLVNLALITLMFAYFSRTRSMDNPEDWNPDDWEELRVLGRRIMSAPAHAVRRSDAIGAILGMLLLLAWWLGLNSVLWRWFGWDPLPFEWTPVWSSVAYVVIPWIVASIGREVMGLLRPRWMKAYLGIGVLLDFVGLTVLSRLLRAGTYVVPAGEGPLTFLAGFANAAVFLILLVMTIGALIGLVFSVRRFLALPASWTRATV